jgi:7-alpha-hydroxysteroid dehydrogenase
MYKDKVLVLSGGTKGIGKNIIYRFAEKQCNIAFTYNSNEEEAKSITEDLTKKYKIKVKYYKLNILEPNEYKELFKKIDEDFDRVDYFISNAIISGRSVVGGFAPFMRLKPKGMTNIYTATVLAFIVGAQEAAKRMMKIGGGSIVSLSSTGNLVHIENYTGHGSSKAAVETTVKYAALELAPENIRVNVVSGGPIETDALMKFPDYENLKNMIISRTPMGRMGQSNDMGGVALFLCSDDAKWITGQTIVVDGGSVFS